MNNMLMLCFLCLMSTCAGSGYGLVSRSANEETVVTKRRLYSVWNNVY
jgi:hypothetical protein